VKIIKGRLDLSDQLKEALIKKDRTVPVTIFGDTVGTAVITDDGDVIIKVSSSKAGQELMKVILAGWSDSIALSPNITSQKET
jgi:hypothetical protein